MSIKTNKDLQRQRKEIIEKTEYQKKQEEAKIRQQKSKLNEKKKGLYKKVIIQSFLNEFSNNYGESFDYNSLVDSITFNFAEDKEGDLLPDFSFKESKVIFKSDAEKEGQKFNENSYQDFVSNEDMIDGSNVSRYEFDSWEEYESYENGDIMDSDLDFLDGQFIAVSNNKDRYGNFNKINKLVGYTPTGESAKSAKKSAIAKWSKLNK